MSKVTNMSLLVLVLVTMLLEDTTMAQSSCTNVLITMAPCLNYVTGSSPILSTSCCSQLASVVQRQPRCLCMALNGGGASLGFSINRTLALAMPAACNVQTPPVSLCDDGASPADPPEGLSGPKAVPLAGMSSPIVMNVPFHFLLLVLLMRSYASSRCSSF